MLLTFPVHRTRKPGSVTHKTPSAIVALFPKPQRRSHPPLVRKHPLAGIQHSTHPAPMTQLDEQRSLHLIRDLLALRGRYDDAFIAQQLVRFIGSNCFHPKLKAKLPSSYYRLRVISTIFTLNKGKRPEYLINRLRAVLKER